MKLRWVTIALVAALGGGLTACGSAGANSPSAAAGGSGSAGTPASGSSGVLGALGVQQQQGSPGPGSSGGSPGPDGSPSAQPSPTKSSAKAAKSPSSGPSGNGGSGGGTAGSVSGNNFTVPSVPGDNVVRAYGSFDKLSSERVKVTICAVQTGAAYAVGALALVYNTSGGSKNIGAVVLTGPGNKSCGTTTFLFYGAHLRVHAFIGGNDGTIKTTGPVLDIY